MQLLKYILYTGMTLLLAIEAAGQAVPWTITPTGSNHTIFIKTTVNPSVENEPLLAGDVIAVFYDSMGTLACGGYIEWNNANTFITAYGDDGITKGFKQNELLKYKIWRKASNCIIDIVNVDYVVGGSATETNLYKENGLSEISTLVGVISLKAENFDVQVTNATCMAGGKFLIEETMGSSIADIQFIVEEVISGTKTTSDANEIVQLPEGDYKLVFINKQTKCVASWPETLQILKDPNCIFPVISPNKDGVAEDIYIPFPGSTKIYDRNGVLLNEFITPATWSATDSNGRPLPMGTYIIVCDGQKEIMVTIVR